MQCTNPLLALRYYKRNDGKLEMRILPRDPGRTFDFLKDRYGLDNIMQLPCGTCPACLARRSKEWAVRCCMESLCWQHNCFVTLTYDDEHYTGTFDKVHLKKFIKAFRNKGYKVRYYIAAERGDQFGRCHYHAIIFNYFPADAKPYAKSKSGYMQYTSKELDEFWDHKGFVTVAEFHPFNAQYVAGYVVKKIIAADDSFHMQSTRPGIGAAYFLQHIEEIYETDNLVLNFGSHVFSVPRYFDKLVEKLDLDLSDIKTKRLEKGDYLMHQQMRDHGISSLDQLVILNGEAVEKTIKRKKRCF